MRRDREGGRDNLKGEVGRGFATEDWIDGCEYPDPNSQLLNLVGFPYDEAEQQVTPHHTTSHHVDAPLLQCAILCNVFHRFHFKPDLFRVDLNSIL